MSLMGLLVNWTYLTKESWSWSYFNRNIQNYKQKQRKGSLRTNTGMEKAVSKGYGTTTEVMCNENARNRTKESKRNIWNNNAWEFPLTNDIHQMTGPGSL